MAGSRGVGGLYGGGFGVGGDVGCWFDAKGVSCSSSSLPLDGFFVSGSSSSFLGSSSIVNFEDVCGRKRSDRSFFGGFPDETGDDDLDDYFHHPEKKRRLTAEQVQFLERSFEAENKLEPERKVQLAKDLGLQPRQVAIWFQNRRARWKTKQLEKDFDTLQTSYDSLKADYENLLKEKEKLKAEVLRLTDKLHLKEKEEEQWEPSNMYSNQPETPQQELIVGSTLEDDDAPPVSVLAVKRQDLSSTKSDELDSDNFCYFDAGHSSFVEPGDSSYVIEHEHSDISQDEEDNLSNTLMPSCYLLPKMESAGDHPESPAYSCNFGLQVEDHAPWFWSS